jgi:hypothetical protein
MRQSYERIAPSMCTTGMLSRPEARQPMTVFVSPRKTVADGRSSASTGYSFAITDPATSASVEPVAPSSISGGAIPSSRRKTSFMLSE